MLKLLNLFVLSRIFANAKSRLTPHAEALYISCLIQYFSDKEPTTKNQFSFDLKTSDLHHNVDVKHLRELHDAGLIILDSITIHFPNLWGQLIDRSLLDKEPSAKNAYTPSPASDYKEDLLMRESLYENCIMQYRINRAQITELIHLFIIQQTDEETRYLTIAEASRHCGYWIGKNLHKLKSLDKTVKSTAKRLGV